MAEPSPPRWTQVWSSDVISGQQQLFAFPAEVCFLTEELVAVADVEHRKLSFLRNGVVTSEINDISAMGITRATDESVYVAEGSKAVVFEVDVTGRQRNSWGHGLFKEPAAVVVSGDKIVVTDSALHVMSIHDSRGRCIRQFGGQGDKDEQFNHPYFMATDQHGRIIVTDHQNSAVNVFDRNGKFVNKICDVGSGQGQFHFPKGVACDSEGNILVADWGNNRIQKYSSDCRFVETLIGQSDGGVTQRPIGLAWRAPGLIALTARRPTGLCALYRAPQDLLSQLNLSFGPLVTSPVLTSTLSPEADLFTHPQMAQYAQTLDLPLVTSQGFMSTAAPVVPYQQVSNTDPTLSTFPNLSTFPKYA